MKTVAAAAPDLPFYLYDINTITGIRCTYINMFLSITLSVCQ